MGSRKKTGIIIPFVKRQNHTREVDGKRVRDYVYSRIDFPLPEHIYEIIDALLAEFWNGTSSGDYLEDSDFERAVMAVKDYNILLPPNRARAIARYVTEILESDGFITRS